MDAKYSKALMQSEHPLMEIRGTISMESATTNESSSRNSTVDVSPPLSTSSPSDSHQLETDSHEKSPSSQEAERVHYSIPMAGGGRSEDNKISRRGEHSVSLMMSGIVAYPLPAIAEEKKQQQLKRSDSRNRSSVKRRNLAIEYIRTRSCSIDSTKICEDFYNDYLAPEAGKPHQYGFVQLDVLKVSSESTGLMEWQEISRWIKYQEDLEGDGDRWGHPHIASLTFNSITTLRNLIETSGILLDLQETNILGVISKVVEELASRSLIRLNEMSQLISTLLSKHKKLQEGDQGWFKLKALGNVQNIFDEKKPSMSIASGHAFLDSTIFGRRRSSASNQQISLSSSPETQQQQQSSVKGALGSRDSLKARQDSVNIELNSKFKSADKYSYPSQDEPKSSERSSIRNLLPSSAEATVVMVGDIEHLLKPTIIFVRLLKSSLMPEVTEVEIPVRFVSILLVPANVDIDQLEIGRSFGALMSNRDFYEGAITARGLGSFIVGINQFLEESITISPGNWENYDLLSRHKLQEKNASIRLRSSIRKEPEVFEGSVSEEDELVAKPEGNGIKKPDREIGSPFVRTGYPFGGLINDIRRRYPKYKSDIKDGLNSQCFAAVVFMYFASLAQIIPFAVLMAEKTENMIAIPETLLPTAGAGVFFSLTAAQPLLLLGTTVPLLIFDEILFKVCRLFSVEFLPTRVWISIWVILITIIVEFFEGNTLIKWVTRFTQDIFICLTSCLLIYESFRSIFNTYKIHPLGQCPAPTTDYISASHDYYFFNVTTASPISDGAKELRNQPNTALFCTILTLGTFSVAYCFREFKTSIYLNEKVRKHLGHFAVPIAISIMLIVTYTIGATTYTQKLKVPSGLETTRPLDRGWLISPLGLKSVYNPWVAVAAFLPALLIYVILSMTTEICELLINTKERRLIKGTGFHLDILLVACINFICAIFGGPWICSPPMRAIAHIDSLTVYSKNNPPGENPTFIRVREQRITNLAISTLVGCSTFLAPMLQAIPLAVLFGVFMYMGVTAMLTTQLFARFNLLFIPPIHHPSVPYVKRVRTEKMHLYTLVQISCVGFLCAVMSAKEPALFFPCLLMLLVPIRLQLKRIFTEEELSAVPPERGTALLDVINHIRHTKKLELEYWTQDGHFDTVENSQRIIVPVGPDYDDEGEDNSMPSLYRYDEYDEDTEDWTPVQEQPPRLQPVELFPSLEEPVEQHIEHEEFKH